MCRERGRERWRRVERGRDKQKEVEGEEEAYGERHAEARGECVRAYVICERASERVSDLARRGSINSACV